MAHFVWQNGCFWRAKWLCLECKTAVFAKQGDYFCDSKRLFVLFGFLEWGIIHARFFNQICWQKQLWSFSINVYWLLKSMCATLRRDTHCLFYDCFTWVSSLIGPVIVSYLGLSGAVSTILRSDHNVLQLPLLLLREYPLMWSLS